MGEILKEGVVVFCELVGQTFRNERGECGSETGVSRSAAIPQSQLHVRISPFWSTACDNGHIDPYFSAAPIQNFPSTLITTCITNSVSGVDKYELRCLFIGSNFSFNCRPTSVEIVSIPVE